MYENNFSNRTFKIFYFQWHKVHNKLCTNRLSTYMSRVHFTPFSIYCLLCVINIYIVFDIFSLLLNLNFFFFLVLILKTGKSSLAKPHWVMSFVCWLDSVQATLGPRYVLNMCIKYICMFQSFLILLENSINIL